MSGSRIRVSVRAAGAILNGMYSFGTSGTPRPPARPGAPRVPHDVEELHAWAGVHRLPDVLRDLGNIVDDEQPNLIVGHVPDYTPPADSFWVEPRSFQSIGARRQLCGDTARALSTCCGRWAGPLAAQPVARPLRTSQGRRHRPGFPRSPLTTRPSAGRRGVVAPRARPARSAGEPFGSGDVGSFVTLVMPSPIPPPNRPTIRSP